MNGGAAHHSPSRALLEDASLEDDREHVHTLLLQLSAPNTPHPLSHRDEEEYEAIAMTSYGKTPRLPGFVKGLFKLQVVSAVSRAGELESAIERLLLSF